MSVSFTNLTSGSDTDGNSTCTTASVTLTSNRLHLLSVTQFESTGSASNAPTCTGWTQVATHEFYTAAGVLFARQTVLRRLGAGETGTHTIDFASQNQTEVRWAIDQSDANVDTTGTNGSGAIVQTANGTASAAASVSATLAAFGSTDNGTFGSVGAYGGGMSTWTQGTGFTKLADAPGGFSTDISLLTEYRTDNDTSVDASMSSSVDAAGLIAIEIKAAATGTSITAGLGQLALTGLAPAMDFGFATGLGQLVLTGFAPTAELGNKEVSAGLGQLVITGYEPTLSVNGSVSISSGVGALALTGYAPDQTLTLYSPGPGALVLTGYAPTLTQAGSFTITPDVGILEILGLAPEVDTGSRRKHAGTSRKKTRALRRRLIVEQQLEQERIEEEVRKVVKIGPPKVRPIVDEDDEEILFL